MEREWLPVRRLYLSKYPTCVACRTEPSTDVHEITRGALRKSGFVEPATWLAVCWRCNMYQLVDYSVWPIARQLACKLVMDSTNFDLDCVNSIRAGCHGRIDIVDVAKYLDFF